MAVPRRKSNYVHRRAHIMPAGLLSATCADRATCWGTQEVFDKSTGLPPLAQSDSVMERVTHSPMLSLIC